MSNREFQSRGSVSAAASGFAAPGSVLAARPSSFVLGPRRRAFTLIELILVMAILTMMVAVSAPTLANFFGARSLDYEARRLLALTRQGQSRAVSEGVPMDLWVDAARGSYGLAAEPSYETSDPKATDFTLDQSLQLEVINSLAASTNSATPPATAMGLPPSTASVLAVHLARPALPAIRFLPDGSIGDSSPQKLRLVARDGASLWLVQSANRLSYEIRNTGN